MSKSINALLVDFNVSEQWGFYQTLKRTTKCDWKIYKCVSNCNYGNVIQNLIRYFKYFLLPVKIFFISEQFEHILAWQQFYGLILAFYFRIFKVKKNVKITVMTFIYKPRKAPVIGKIYERFIKYIVTSDYIDYFIIFSHSERSYYSSLFGINIDKFKVLKLGIEDVKGEYSLDSFDEQYFISAGRSNRDYPFLCDIWKDISKMGREKHLSIISDTIHKNSSESIKYMDKCHGKEYFKELSKCYAVIIPLKDRNISSGQLVILQAMMLGKPVIVTKNDTIFDYIIDGFNGLIIEKNKFALLEAINKLYDKKTYKMLSYNARVYFQKNFSICSLGVQVSKIIQENK